MTLNIHSTSFVYPAVLQVFPVHDQVQLRGPAHPGPSHTAQQQRRVASCSKPTDGGAGDDAPHPAVRGAAGAAACAGAGGSVRRLEVK